MTRRSAPRLPHLMLRGSSRARGLRTAAGLALTVYHTSLKGTRTAAGHALTVGYTAVPGAP